MGIKLRDNRMLNKKLIGIIDPIAGYYNPHLYCDGVKNEGFGHITGNINCIIGDGIGYDGVYVGYDVTNEITSTEFSNAYGGSVYNGGVDGDGWRTVTVTGVSTNGGLICKVGSWDIIPNEIIGHVFIEVKDLNDDDYILIETGMQGDSALDKIENSNIYQRHNPDEYAYTGINELYIMRRDQSTTVDNSFTFKVRRAMKVKNVTHPLPYFKDTFVNKRFVLNTDWTSDTHSFITTGCEYSTTFHLNFHSQVTNTTVLRESSYINTTKSDPYIGNNVSLFTNNSESFMLDVGSGDIINGSIINKGVKGIGWTPIYQSQNKIHKFERTAIYEGNMTREELLKDEELLRSGLYTIPPNIPVVPRQTLPYSRNGANGDNGEEYVDTEVLTGIIYKDSDTTDARFEFTATFTKIGDIKMLKLTGQLYAKAGDIRTTSFGINSTRIPVPTRFIPRLGTIRTTLSGNITSGANVDTSIGSRVLSFGAVYETDIDTTFRLYNGYATYLSAGGSTYIQTFVTYV